MQDAVQDDGRDERLTVAAAAERLGITKEAVRKRVHRGTLRSDKDPDGTVRVYVPPSGTPSSTPSSPDRELLYAEMRERIAYLERQVEEEREARRRADTLLARLMDRMPELEAPPGEPASSQEPSESPEMAADEQQGRGPAPDAGGPQEATDRPWWQRMFGG